MNADPMDQTTPERNDQPRHPADYRNIHGGDEQFNDEMRDPQEFRFREIPVEKPFECDVCRSRFKRRRHLEDHKKLHTGEKPFKCDDCEKCYIQRSNLDIHKRIHTGEKPYKCDICGKCFIYRTSLVNHKRNHTGEKPFKCYVCGKHFTQRTNLDDHKRTHTGERPFKCDVCEKCFTQRTHLVQHKRIHTGEKPFKCDVCAECFTHRKSLVYHKSSHTGERPFKCDFCGKSYVSKGTLEKHKRTHTDETPFKCDICGKTYKHRLILKIHRRNHTIKKIIKRQSCRKYFVGRWNLLRHQKRHNDKLLLEGDTRKNIFHSNIKLENQKIGVGDFQHNAHNCQKGFSTELKLRKHRKSSAAMTSLKLNAFRVRSQSHTYAEASTSRQEVSSQITSECTVLGKCVSHKSNLLPTEKSPSMEEPHERGFAENAFQVGDSELNEITSYGNNVSENTISEKKDMHILSAVENIASAGELYTSGNCPKTSFSEKQLSNRRTRNGEAVIISQNVNFRKEKSAEGKTLHDVDGVLKYKKRKKCFTAEVQLQEGAESHFVEHPYICTTCRSGFHDYADMKRHAIKCSNKKLKG